MEEKKNRAMYAHYSSELSAKSTMTELNSRINILSIMANGNTEKEEKKNKI